MSTLTQRQVYKTTKGGWQSDIRSDVAEVAEVLLLELLQTLLERSVSELLTNGGWLLSAPALELPLGLPFLALQRY